LRILCRLRADVHGRFARRGEGGGRPDRREDSMEDLIAAAVVAALAAVAFAWLAFVDRA
jgi:hypothetical protein